MAETIFSLKQIEHLRALAGKFDLTKPRHLLDPLLRIDAERPLDASLHRSGGALVLEFEAADTEDRLVADPLAGVQEMIEGFDDAESLQALCQLAADRVRTVAGYDRSSSIALCMTSRGGRPQRHASPTSSRFSICTIRPRTFRSRPARCT